MTERPPTPDPLADDLAEPPAPTRTAYNVADAVLALRPVPAPDDTADLRAHGRSCLDAYPGPCICGEDARRLRAALAAVTDERNALRAGIEREADALAFLAAQAEAFPSDPAQSGRATAYRLAERSARALLAEYPTPDPDADRCFGCGDTDCAGECAQ